ncbi:hypothetical protein SDRG_01568 [Saprolegnia diclina VS20]|uniref:DUF4442 domain-containing protein n=1 Tax=Saprolegnia diclina (strain VS20) TaxID=1156394 RepID=T0QTV6_SAPDV|nr:hypothetical protein SDRG_01568 [Saprolegnia diclina VS20]EQC41609.1 hypothetical protein SDRG_01568 [Saprolegnia diclina VS20]|eukprot:XP_008605323.1 hypothetical protein SDRG_01568 [Saprolegnia diclina VS20]
MSGPVNKLGKLVAKINSSSAPAFLREGALSTAFNAQVKMAGVAGIHVETLTEQKSVVSLKNSFRVQNHIGGVHACGMALLAESASGMVFGMNVRDSHLPLLKSMSMSYVKRAKGDLKAVATLTDAQRDEIAKSDKGEVLVNVVVTDSAGDSPVECEMRWVWVPKRK